MKHPTVKTVLKTALIDKECAPLVRWLNSFASVFTLACCQGNDQSGEKPYVSWLCHDAVTLCRILEVLHGSQTVVSWSGCYLSLLYRTEFQCLQHLRDCLKYAEYHKINGIDHVVYRR